MYFLRRRHGRKPQPDARRETSPAPAPAPFVSHSEVPHSQPEPHFSEADQAEPIRPVVIKKAKRARIATPVEDDCKPAGTFRSGTLHIANGARNQPQHGKL
jgi:hypothetical protein